MIFSKNDKLVMIGDSITDTERKRPYGEGRGEATGKGYVSAVSALINSVYPELSLRIINMGISGNTVRSLKERWQTDVIDLQPDWVSIMIGINDVWRQYDQSVIKETHVYLEEYIRTLDELVKSTKPLVKGIILFTPFYIEPNANDAMRKTMDEYGRAVKEIAASNQTRFIDVQAAFQPVLEHTYPAELAWDRVHPNMTGHMVLARAFLKEVGFDWNKE
ncbi:SGNH/GDSL hydrolase family protein [Paenibacillus radicis (ex Xue et al. 2023)]|uniref:SGNH/GDSL hydrolase family protein n=1 Tax=Paenibacillus radicis (ex Xue et al. 2023) TaxID=2972489 RepID=A0ABT1YE14_9BACL|nr:SGNH/GDSL hydrolase family protein [Paenibacillus radicis (ex Xue et al. 2023)]MCR8631010.1 SGNH/GDSL hydrolase family protein [Paenibacillus radicis (ex Xue et al. 2023)]